MSNLVINPYAFQGGGPPPPPSPIVGVTSQVEESSTSSVIVEFPSGVQQGDLILVIEKNAGGSSGFSLGAPAGWNQRSYNFGTTTGRRATLLWKTYAAADGASQQFFASSASPRSIMCVALRGVSFDSEASNLHTSISSDTYVAPSMTPAGPGVLLCWFGIMKNADSGQPLSVPDGMTGLEYLDAAGFKTLLAWQEVPAGATGTRTSTQAPDTGAGGAVSITTLFAP